ncbi:MAG: hypothetical protein RL266_2028 [Bacteroidota bacterium]|jgi:murein DD-endopeptidase MepM/ murein hydrolase activator NlpD
MSPELIQKGARLRSLIEQHRNAFASVARPPLNAENTILLNLSEPDNIVANCDPTDADRCWSVIDSALKQQDKIAAIGGYAEKRTAYRVNRTLFGDGKDERCIHLGVDIWISSGTTIYAPLDGTVHSLADNAGVGNYGPTIILEHELEGNHFYSLYGHLSRSSIKALTVGQFVKQGEAFATIGSAQENGNWPPHLHYQFIADMMGCCGDFIGVSTEAEAEFYLALCPEPVVL